MVYCNLWLESKNAVFNTIRRIIFHQNMHNHQKSQIESRREELATFALLKLLTLVHLLCVLQMIDITEKHMNCFQHFQN